MISFIHDRTCAKCSDKFEIAIPRNAPIGMGCFPWLCISCNFYFQRISEVEHELEKFIQPERLSEKTSKDDAIV